MAHVGGAGAAQPEPAPPPGGMCTLAEPRQRPWARGPNWHRDTEAPTFVHSAHTRVPTVCRHRAVPAEALLRSNAGAL